MAQCYPERFKVREEGKYPCGQEVYPRRCFFRGKTSASDWIGPPDMFYKRVAKTDFLAARVNDLLRTVYDSWSAALAPGSCRSESEDLTAVTNFDT